MTSHMKKHDIYHVYGQGKLYSPILNNCLCIGYWIRISLPVCWNNACNSFIQIFTAMLFNPGLLPVFALGLAASLRNLQILPAAETMGVYPAEIKAGNILSALPFYIHIYNSGIGLVVLYYSLCESRVGYKKRVYKTVNQSIQQHVEIRKINNAPCVHCGPLRSLRYKKEHESCIAEPAKKRKVRKVCM